jgi:hypothetical protein
MGAYRTSSINIVQKQFIDHSGDSPSHYEAGTKRISAIENYRKGLPKLRLKVLYRPN